MTIAEGMVNGIWSLDVPKLLSIGFRIIQANVAELMIPSEYRWFRETTSEIRKSGIGIAVLAEVHRIDNHPFTHLEPSEIDGLPFTYLESSGLELKSVMPIRDFSVILHCRWRGQYWIVTIVEK